MPGPHPALARLLEAQQRRRVGDRARRLEGLRQLVEPAQLVVHPARAVGVGEMRHQRDGADPGVQAQGVVHRPQLVHAEAEAVHAAVDLEVDVELRRQVHVLDQLDLVGVVDHRRELVLEQQVHVERLEETLQHQDRLRHPGQAQAHRLLEIQHRAAVGIRQGARRALQAVAVGVGLQHRPDLRLAGGFARQFQVVAQGGRLDDGTDRARHGR